MTRTLTVVVALGAAPLFAQPPANLVPLPELARIQVADGKFRTITYRAERRVRVVPDPNGNGQRREVYEVHVPALSNLPPDVEWRNLDGSLIDAADLAKRVKSGTVVAITREKPLHESLRPLFNKSVVNLVTNPILLDD